MRRAACACESPAAGEAAITRGTGDLFADLGYSDAEERQTKRRLAQAVSTLTFSPASIRSNAAILNARSNCRAAPQAIKSSSPRTVTHSVPHSRGALHRSFQQSQFIA